MQIPRPEHPRPQFQRAQWRTLNGVWHFKHDPGDSGRQQGWVTRPSQIDDRIVVPFCPESRLSGIGHTDFMPVVWYYREFNLPADWQAGGQRVHVHFGAVDWSCRVWVNAVEVGGHEGGSSSFSLDISDALHAPEVGQNQIVVRVADNLRSGLQPAGKQSLKLDSFAASYTRTTGIWQSVWLECVPLVSMAALQILPDWPAGRFVVVPRYRNVGTRHTLRCRVTSGGTEVAVSQAVAGDGIPLMIDLPQPRAWSPADPHLYQLQFELLDADQVVDSVASYAGLRQFAIEGDQFLLNGEPLFLRLILDQGFYPEGVWTAPTDADLRADIQRAQALGFNGARLHQKVFEERYHFWADQLGYLTWGEFPDWGLDGMNFFPPRENAEHQARALDNHLREWSEVVERDRNHPSIVLWTPFNEAIRRKGREQRYDHTIRKVYALTKALDPTRPVHDASGWTHILTDVFSVHDYQQDPQQFRQTYADGPCDIEATRQQFGGEAGAAYAGQPFVVDEYGGTWWEAGATGDDSWGYGERPTDAEAALCRIEALTAVLLENSQVAGFCYTQLTDIEQEQNGLYTYARELKFDAARLRAAFSAPAAIERRKPS